MEAQQQVAPYVEIDAVSNTFDTSCVDEEVTKLFCPQHGFGASRLPLLIILALAKKAEMLSRCLLPSTKLLFVDRSLKFFKIALAG